MRLLSGSLPSAYSYCFAAAGLFHLLACLTSVSAFELLPHVRLDHAHYHRLGQCQVSCAQKVGGPFYLKWGAGSQISA